jgi:uncharacterized protein YlzI (FlbEa/FlbD family)
VLVCQYRKVIDACNQPESKIIRETPQILLDLICGQTVVMKATCKDVIDKFNEKTSRRCRSLSLAVV